MSGKRFGKKRVPGCYCEYNFTCGPCLAAWVFKSDRADSDERRYKRATGEYAKPAGSGVFIRTGEFRAPRKSEWYLSGAIPEAWHAPNDLDTPYHILRET